MRVEAIPRFLLTKPIDMYFIYAAFAPTENDEAYIKVGISAAPMRRVYAIHCGSQEPIEVALWAYVGQREDALSIERCIHSRLAEFKTRGEWFKMNMASEDHKRRFHAVCSAAFSRRTGKILKWKKSTFEEICTSLKVGLASAHRVR